MSHKFGGNYRKLIDNLMQIFDDLSNINVVHGDGRCKTCVQFVEPSWMNFINTKFSVRLPDTVTEKISARLNALN